MAFLVDAGSPQCLYAILSLAEGSSTLDSKPGDGVNLLNAPELAVADAQRTRRGEENMETP